MKTWIALLLSLITTSCSVLAQVSAQTYFDQAGKEFVKVDKMQALRTLDEGLRNHPDDPKLLKLAEELIKEDEKQQQEQQKKQEQEQKEDQQQKDKQEQQKEQEQQQEQKEQEQEQKEQQQKEQQEQKQEEAGPEEQKEETGEPKPGTIAPQDAIRMLEALERSEKSVQEKVRAKRRPASRRTIEKDW